MMFIRENHWQSQVAKTIPSQSIPGVAMPYKFGNNDSKYGELFFRGNIVFFTCLARVNVVVLGATL
jgi:hypothetical protein